MNPVSFISPRRYAPRQLCRVAVHIGHEVQKRFEASGLTKKHFAEQLGRSYQSLYALFEQPTMDSGLLQRCSKALAFNFFKLLSDEMDKKVPSLPVANEPAATYQTKTAGGVGLTIHVDPNDPESTRKLLKALKALGE